MTNDFQLTYATMFDPPEELHIRFEGALQEKRANLGREYGMLVGGKEVFADHAFKVKNPARKDQVLASFPTGTPGHADQAVAAAKSAFSEWSRTPWQERLRKLRKAADLIDDRVFEIAAATTLEVGKNRLEALGDVSEAPALIRYACDQMEREEGFIKKLGEDPLKGYQATNYSVLKPYGVWLVISPFNFPSALTGGPVGAALLAGNTVVMKPAAKTSWSVRMLAECFLDAGLPEGAVNFVTGSGSVLGASLVDHPDVDGVTFTGSYEVGMRIQRAFSKREYVHPVILELGGKNPAIVSRHADLGRAVKGIVRSAFGLQGQKCSANSRVYVEEPIYDEMLERVVEKTEELIVGDPGERETFMGPVISEGPYRDFMDYTEELSRAGTILTGGKVLTRGEFSEGYYCQPTVAAEVPYGHRLWGHEMFLPITMIGKVKDLDQAMALANDVQYGLTAGFYGTEAEAEWFFENIQAGVNYVNRPQGSTTGAWPGYQPFGGWKASGSTGANAGGPYYLQRYMREQVQTVIR